MTNLFHAVLNMSVTAAVVIAAVALIRLPLSKTPKAITCGLWFVALFRLLCPVSFRSAVSLFSLRRTPSMTYIQPDIQAFSPPAVSVAHLSAAPVNAGTVVPAAMPDAVKTGGSSVTVLSVLALVWAAVAAGLLIYGAVSYIRLRRRIRTATRVEGNIYETDRIASPFVAGLFRPAIFLPVGLGGGVRALIIEHEKTHINRRDYITKLLWYLAVCLHWFNPLVWGAFYLVSRDMEMRCDEAVVRKLGDAVKAEYSDALLALSAPRAFFAANPLAFGEGSLLSRIKKVLSFKRPVTWVVVAALAVAVALTVVLAANPTASAAGSTEAAPPTSALAATTETAPPAASADAGAVTTVNYTVFRLGKNGVVLGALSPRNEAQKTLVENALSTPLTLASSRPTVDPGSLNESYLIRAELTDNAPGLSGRTTTINYYLFKHNGFYCLQHGKTGMYSTIDEGYYAPLKQLMDTQLSGAAAEVEKKLSVIMSSPALSSNPGDYMTAHQTEYQDILKMGDPALSYMLSCFNNGEGNTLKGYIMMYLCSDLLGIRSSLDGQNLFPADWFARLKIGGETELPDYVYTGDDPVTKLIYETETVKHKGWDGGFTVVAVHEFGRFEEGKQLKVFVSTCYASYHLNGQKLEAYDGQLLGTNGYSWHMPTAITFTKTQNGTYALTDYQQPDISSANSRTALDDAYKKFASMPGSGSTIPGLADKLQEFNGVDLNKQLISNLKELLKKNGITVVTVPDI